MKNILKDYPQPTKPRYLSKNFRNFKDRIIASYRDHEFFHGSRSTGYGGYKYDSRWKKVAQNCCELFNLKPKSKILHINCEFGFLISDLKEIDKNFEVYGTETSEYAISNSLQNIKSSIKYCNPTEINYPQDYFDLVIALGVVYTQTLTDAIKLLKIISNISKKNNSFITLATYSSEVEKNLFNDWTLGGNLCLKREEWKLLFEESNYLGEYLFVDSNYLSLKYE